MIPTFLRILYEPTIALREEKNKATLFWATLNYALTGANLGVVGILFLSITQTHLQKTQSIGNGIIQIIQYAIGPGFEAIFVVPLLAAFIAVMLGIVFSGVTWVIANALGGKGTWRDNMYLTSFLFLPITIGSYFANLIVINATIAGIVSTLWGIYVIYIATKTIMVANMISFARALLTFFSPLLIAIVLQRLIPF